LLAHCGALGGEHEVLDATVARAALAARQPAFLQHVGDDGHERGVAAHPAAKVSHGHGLGQFEQGPEAELRQAVVPRDLVGDRHLPGRQLGHGVEDLRVGLIRRMARHHTAAASPPATALL
jgi:hypothetical protein